MKKLFSFLIMSPLFISMVYTQTLSDYISEVKGDTLVVKDFYEMENKENSLFYALFLDTVNVPKGRVYELKTNGYYPLLNSPVTSENRHTVIIGSDPTPLVNDKNSSPPLICSVVAEMEGLPAFGIRGDFSIKNCKLVPANAAGALGWSFFYTKKSDLNLLFENCLFEHTRWVFVYNDAEHCNVTFKDCYFVNMSGYSQDDYMGGVIHSGESLESLVVENCTFIMAQGDLFNLGSNSANRTILNHNTFINCAGHILLSTCLRYICYKNLGLINNVSLTNNMFINCNLQPLDSCMIPDSDGKDYPAGIVNTNQTYIDSINTTQIKYLAQNNLAYWHPIIANCDSILNANTVNGSNCWQPQTFIMTSVTQELFNEDGDYPYLVTDTWKNKMPAFTKTQDLFTTQLENITKFVVEFADTSEQAFLPHWRVINNASNQFIYPDWPIPIDLSYSDADLLKGGIGGFPLGDLNWFPTKKAEWLKQRDSEYNNISEALNKGELVTAVQNQEIFPSQFYLYQNYPNPFNPTTTIKYDLPKESDVKIIIYDILGKEVAKLVNERKNAGKYEISWNANRFASGVYFYELQVDNYRSIRKLLLLK